MTHQFWDNFPIMHDGTVVPVDKNSSIEDMKSYARPAPYNLPPGFSWTKDKIPIEDISAFLQLHYVDDIFKLQYTTEFLRYCLYPKTENTVYENIIFGVLYEKKLMAFIAGIPITLKISDKIVHMMVVNFMCVHPAIRNKRLTPVLIKELTRRSCQMGIIHCLYSSVQQVALPLSVPKFYHRILNVPKTLQTGFYIPKNGETTHRLTLRYRLPSTPTIKLRNPAVSDISEMKKSLDAYSVNFKISQIFSTDEIEHYFFSPHCVTRVVGDFAEKSLLEFFAFTLMDVTKDNGMSVKVASLFFCTHHSTPLDVLGEAMLIVARDYKADCFTCLDTFKFSPYFERLKFQRGRGKLNYYLGNWETPPISPENLAFTML